jgi:hypothetical protein
VPPIDLFNAEPQTPAWWLRRLLARLEQDVPDMRRWERYYDGDQPLDFFDAQVREKFSGRFRRFTANYVALVVDSFAERLKVTGFRFKDSAADDDLWDIWQANDLDGGSAQAHTDALVKRRAYALIEPPAGDAPPRITMENALNAFVETDPRDRRKRLAGIKRYIDGDGRLVAYLYLPDTIYRFRSGSVWPESWTPWDPDGVNADAATFGIAGGFELWPQNGDDGTFRNPIGVVPLVPILNRPRIGSAEGRSEVHPITSNQDLINYYRAMSVVAARYLAIPQRWVKNLDVEVDPATGQPRPPFKGGIADLWVVEPMAADDPRASIDAAQTEFGQFPAADLSSYDTLSSKEIIGLASVAGLPYYYLLDTGVNAVAAPSGESIKASEARLTKKVDHMETYFGEGWEETMRVALRAMGDERWKLRTAETLWAQVETQNEAVRADAVTKIKAAGLMDDRMALEALGYSPQAIKRFVADKAKREEEAKKEAADALANQPPAGPGGPLNGAGAPPARPSAPAPRANGSPTAVA